MEGASKRQSDFVYGRTGRGMTVNFAGNTDMIGRILPVHIIASGTNTLRGELI